MSIRRVPCQFRCALPLLMLSIIHNRNNIIPRRMARERSDRSATWQLCEVETFTASHGAFPIDRKTGFSSLHTPARARRCSVS